MAPKDEGIKKVWIDSAHVTVPKEGNAADRNRLHEQLVKANTESAAPIKTLSTGGLTSEQLNTAKAALQDSLPTLKRLLSTPGLESVFADVVIGFANSIARIDRTLRARQRYFLSGSTNERIHIVRGAGAAKILGDDRRRSGGPLVRE
jgi:hypothetical protein